MDEVKAGKLRWRGLAWVGAWRRPADHLLKKIIISLSKSEALRPDVDFP